MIENGFLKFVYQETEYDEDGNVKEVESQESDSIPCSIQGVIKFYNQNSESNSKFEEANFTIFINYPRIRESNRLKLFDIKKNLLGEFWIKSRQDFRIVRQIKFIV